MNAGRALAVCVLACGVFGSAETDMLDPKTETEVERLKAKALARWESEGGALAASKSDQALDDTSLRILNVAGAASPGEQPGSSRAPRP